MSSKATELLRLHEAEAVRQTERRGGGGGVCVYFLGREPTLAKPCDQARLKLPGSLIMAVSTRIFSLVGRTLVIVYRRSQRIAYRQGERE
jgi:hypothetical protein